MASRVVVPFKNHTFEEHPVIIGWAQLFLLHELEEIENLPDWMEQLKLEWEANVLVDAYKYFFYEELIGDSNKIEWLKPFLNNSINDLIRMSPEEFAKKIGESEFYPKNMNRVEYVLRSCLESLGEGN